MRVQIVYVAVASSLEVVRPYCVVITTTPTTSAHSLVQVPHKYGTAMAASVKSAGCWDILIAMWVIDVDSDSLQIRV